MISTKGRYALRVMIDLAQHDTGTYISLKDIAERQNISMKYLESIVSILNKSGMLLSQRGKMGGYRLAKSLQEYTIGEILKCSEGPMVPVNCLEGETNRCERSDSCITLPMWQKLDRIMDDYLESITLADLLAGKV